MSASPSELEDLQLRMRDLHFTTFNGLNTIFTGGLIANLLHLALTRSDRWQTTDWLLAANALMVFIACWVGLARMLVLLRFPPRIWDALLSFATASACYALLFQIEVGAVAWLHYAALVALLGGLGTLNMLFAGGRDAYNATVVRLVGKDILYAGVARVLLSGLVLGFSLLPLPEIYLAGTATLCCVLALCADEWVWGRTIDHAFAATPRARYGRMGTGPVR